MSRLKLLTTIVTLILTLPIVTSCLNSGEPSEVVQAHFAEVQYAGMGQICFVDAAGVKLFPTSQSILALEAKGLRFDEGIAFIQYSIVPQPNNDGLGVPAGYSIDLIGAAIINRDFIYTSTGGPEDLISTAPVSSLDRVLDSNNELFIMNNRYLILSVNYYLGATSDGKPKPHHFAVTYKNDETTPGSTSLKLYLRHDSEGDTSTQYYSAITGNVTLYCMSFDLKQAIDHFKTTTGKEEFIVSLTADIADEFSQELVNAEQREYTVTYKSTASQD